VALVEQTTAVYVQFKFLGGEVICLPTDQLSETTERILKRYNVPHHVSPDLCSLTDTNKKHE